MIIRVSQDHRFYIMPENTAESKFLSWRLDSSMQAKDRSYTVDSQEFMTLMRKFTKAKIEQKDEDSSE